MTHLYLLCRCLPSLMISTSILGAVCQYLCYWYDGALHIHIGSGNKTDINLDTLRYVSVGLNIIRFTSLFHIYYMMFLLLFMIVVTFYGIFRSQKQFNRHMGTTLKNFPPTITFAKALRMFDRRLKILSAASSNWTIIPTSVVVATSVSFVVNAYNFLFIKKFAIYVWFACEGLCLI